MYVFAIDFNSVRDFVEGKPLYALNFGLRNNKDTIGSLHEGMRVIIFHDEVAANAFVRIRPDLPGLAVEVIEETSREIDDEKQADFARRAKAGRDDASLD